MSSDYKYAIQMRAEEEAEEKYGADFYSLTQEQQYEIYTSAMRGYGEILLDRADYLRKAEREK